MALALLAACGAVIGAACENTAGQCELTAECTGAPGVVPGACDPNIADGPIPETCGTFASASADAAAGNGSPSQPYSTLEQAIDAAKQTSARVVYACAETFTENVVLPADFILYGGLDCKNGWALAPEARTTVAPAADIPLTFEAGETIHVENVLALAPDGAPADAASEATLSGGSSIAALALSGSKVDLLRCDLVAGNGAPGATIAAAPQGPAAPNGERGEDACVSGGTGLGGTGGDQTCDAMTSGGDGGMAGESGAPDGQSGVSGSPPGVGGAPGTGQTASNDCTPGVPGTKGGTGDPGEGGELSPGLLDTATWKGNPGTSGKAGRDGSGGGGGRRRQGLHGRPAGRGWGRRRRRRVRGRGGQGRRRRWEQHRPVGRGRGRLARSIDAHGPRRRRRRDRRSGPEGRARRDRGRRGRGLGRLRGVRRRRRRRRR